MVFSLWCFCQRFAQSVMPFDPMSDCPRPIHLSKPCLFRCQLFCEATLAHPPGPCSDILKMCLLIFPALKSFPSCLFVSVDCLDPDLFVCIGWRQLNRAEQCGSCVFYGQPHCWSLVWKGVVCPTGSAKANLHRMECYTNRSRAQVAEISHMPLRDYGVCFRIYPPVET